MNPELEMQDLPNSEGGGSPRYWLDNRHHAFR